LEKERKAEVGIEDRDEKGLANGGRSEKARKEDWGVAFSPGNEKIMIRFGEVKKNNVQGYSGQGLGEKGGRANALKKRKDRPGHGLFSPIDWLERGPNSRSGRREGFNIFWWGVVLLLLTRGFIQGWEGRKKLFKGYVLPQLPETKSRMRREGRVKAKVFMICPRPQEGKLRVGGDTGSTQENGKIKKLGGRLTRNFIENKREEPRAKKRGTGAGSRRVRKGSPRRVAMNHRVRKRQRGQGEGGLEKRNRASANERERTMKGALITYIDLRRKSRGGWRGRYLSSVELLEDVSERECGA